MHRLRSALLTIVLAAALPSMVVAQAGTTGLGWDIPSSTRGMALGGAYMMNAQHPDAVFQHPALLRGVSGMTLDIQRWGPASGLTSAAAATSWFAGSLGVAVGVQSMQHGFVPPTSGPIRRALDPLFGDGVTPVSERAAFLGVSRTLGVVDDVDWGMALRLSEERVGTDRNTDVELLLGATREIGPVRVGVTYPDVLSSVSDLHIGVGSYGWELGFLDVGVAARMAGLDDELIAGGGLELGYWPVRGRTFVGRVGLQTVPDGSEASPWSVGFAFWGDDLVLEWAFQPFDGAPESGSHRFSIGWR